MRLFNNYFAGLCSWMLLFSYSAPSQVVISEFMASNKDDLADEDGDNSDWIELQNTGASPVSVNGWYLTDNSGNLTKWRLPNTNIAANGFLVIFASGKDRAVPGLPLHTSFSLSAGGEYLGLIGSNGVNVRHSYSPQFPEQYEDISYGLLNGTNVYFGTSTPGGPNSTNSVAFVADTKFSHDRGFYLSNFSLTITSQTTNAVIRYTTNGTVPSFTNGLVYSGPIPISKTTVIRAAAFKTGFEPSNADTQTYFFLNDVIQQSLDGSAPPGWPVSWGTNVVNYGMDPDILNNPAYSTIKADLRAIPSVSLVMKLEDLFDPSTGIYANAGQKGTNWERPASIELIYADGTKGFQIDAGIRIRGGFSRSGQNPKHSFRFFFRNEYGDSTLQYPLFGESGTDTFDGFDLPTPQNHTWHIHAATGVGVNGVYLRDHFCRDTQLAMGHQAERGIYAHLYINGQYWGLYSPSERTEASYGASYFGGDKEDYDVIKATGAPENIIEVTDGNMEAWTRLWQAATNGFASDADYQRVQGNNPDGSRNPSYEVLLDVDNLIDYMLIMFYSGSRDAPITPAGVAYNFFALRKRDGDQGFKFFVHDFEHTLLSLTEDRTTLSTSSALLNSNPYYFWQRLRSNPNFRVKFGDRVQRHFFNSGALTPEKCIERFKVRTNQLHKPLVGESARWGDAQRPTSPYTRDVHWLAVVNNLLTNYFPQRTGIVLNQLKTIGLYPSVAAPSFNQHGGNVAPGFGVSITATNGTIYYTTDGTDPRLPGGAISPTAHIYGTPILLAENTTIKSRALFGGMWSALNEADFIIIQTFTDLLVTEIMYHPAGTATVDADEFEFLELKNVASTNLDLSGVHFTTGITYQFPNGTVLLPGEFVVLVSNPDLFQERYPGVMINGVYVGKLSNGGETLTLNHAAGTTITTVPYSEAAPWPVSADGHGFSIVPRNPNLNLNPGNGSNWRASGQTNGSPGADDLAPAHSAIVINEILTHTDPPLMDSVELYNPTTNAVDISYWFLTDDRTTPLKYRIPAGTTIQPGGYVVFRENQFNANPGSLTNFNLSSHGEELYLYAANVASNLTGYSDGLSFDAAANGVSFGRYVTSAGEIKYPAQLTITLTNANAGPRVGPIVINEIRYQPVSGQPEFIEFKNISSNTVKLYDPEYPTNHWQVNGISFTFPASVEILPGGLFVVVGTDPVVFRTENNIPGSVPILGPYSGVLQDNGEQLQLQRPDSPDTEGGVTVVPYITVDEVRYSSSAPWPVSAAQSGSSLERINPSAYGNDPINWRGRAHGATPGFENDLNLAPYVDAGADHQVSAGAFPFTLALNATVLDDVAPGPLTMLWQQVSGPHQVTFSPTNSESTSVLVPGVGNYTFRLTASDGEFTVSDTVTIGIQRATYDVSYLPAGSVWRYFDNGTDQGTAWRETGFDDSGWASGPGEFGYGDADESTVVASGPSGARFVTTYFRTRFVVAPGDAVTALTLGLIRDDGAVIYLNGNEIMRNNMPTGAVHYTTLAPVLLSPPQESTFVISNLNAFILAPGTNVLAVEIHQANTTGTDMSFDMYLYGTSWGTNQPPLVQAGTNLTVNIPQPAMLSGTVVDDGLPLSPGVVSHYWQQLGGPAAVTFANSNAMATTVNFTQPGSYQLGILANDGALEAGASLTVNVQPETFGSWRTLFFTQAELSNSSISGEDADPDGDGMTNEQEFISGTDPRDPQSVLRIQHVELSSPGTGITLEFVAAARRTYSIQYKTSLTGGTWTKLTDIVAEASNRTVEISDPGAPSSGRYYRIIAPAE